MFSICKFKDYELLGEEYEGRLFLHILPELTKMTHTLYKDFVLVLEMTKETLSNKGTDKVYVLVPQSLEKFEGMFGFETIGRIEKNNELYVLMEQPTKCKGY